MPVLSGVIADVTNTPITADDLVELFVKVPAPRVSGSGTDQIITMTTVTVDVDPVNGSFSVNLDPGVAILVVRTFQSHDTFNLAVRENMTTIREAIIEEIGALPELEASELVALAAQVRADHNRVRDWHDAVEDWYPVIEDWHGNVDAWQAQVAEDRQTAHDASALAVLAAANAGRIMGTGSPEGVKDAPIGTIYVNTSNGELWHKTTAEGSTSGWKRLGADSWYKSRLTSTTDLNDIRGADAVGVYPVAASVVNGPGSAGWVTVTFDSNTSATKQVFTPSSPGGFTDLKRVYQSSWRDWEPTSWRAGSVSSSTSLDDVSQYGVWTVISGNTPNWPYTTPGSLLTLSAGSTSSSIVQLAIANSTTKPRMSLRARWSTTWTSWVEYTDLAAVEALVSDKINNLNIPEPGEAIDWTVQTSGFSGDMDTLTSPGTWPLLTNATNKPFSPLGSVLVLPVPYGACIQLATNWSTGEQWFRRSTSGTFNTWSKLGGGGTASPTTTRSTVGYREVPLSITAPGTTSTQDVAEGSVRWVRSWSHAPRRFRVHVMNRNPANAVNSAAVTLTGGSFGIGASDGSVTDSAPLFANGAVIPASGGELVSKWMEFPGTGRDALAISLGWSGATTQQRLQGGGWTSTNANDWSKNDASGWTFDRLTPFYVWIEAEVPATAPIILVNGDSISIGTQTDNPVTDSWIAIHCRAHGSLPVFFSQHGSSMNGWSPTASRWNNMYPGMTVAPDAILSCLGQNDLSASGMDVPTLQSRFQSLKQAYTEKWPGVPVYAATVTPSTKPSDVELVRRNFNNWLKELPEGVRGLLDLVPVVGSADDETLASQYSADGLHPNSAGQAALGALLDAHPITPFVLNGAALRGLVA